jgi:nucleoid-associated protein YgaU
MQGKQAFVFSSLAAAALAALGGAYYHNQHGKQAEPVLNAVARTEAEVPQPTVKAAEPAPQSASAVQPQEQAAKALPAFDTVLVEPTGETVIAGRAEPGSVVVAKVNGEVVGAAEANAEGAFAIVPEKPLAAGTGALTLQMSKNGSVTESTESVVVAIKNNAPALVAKIDPVAPTSVTQVPAAADAPPPETVQLNAVDYDTQGNIMFTGRAKPQATVRFYVDNTPAGETRAESGGHWQFKGGIAVPPGQHMLRADEVDATGKVLSRIELPFFRESEDVVATTAEAQPVVQTPSTPPAPERPGTKLAATEAIVPQRLVIQPGHSLWKLSRQIYGKGRLYTVIYEANREQLRNPHRIYPGQILTAPQRKSN